MVWGELVEGKVDVPSFVTVPSSDTGVGVPPESSRISGGVFSASVSVTTGGCVAGLFPRMSFMKSK